MNDSLILLFVCTLHLLLLLNLFYLHTYEVSLNVVCKDAAAGGRKQGEDGNEHDELYC